MSETKYKGYVLRTDLLYTKTHEWLRVENQKAHIGVTDFVRHKIMEVTAIHLPEVGRSVTIGDPVVDVETLKVTFAVHSPVSGKVMAVNEQLTSRPHLLKQDPYGKGWVLAIELSAMEELKQLLSPEQYGKHMDESLFIY